MIVAYFLGHPVYFVEWGVKLFSRTHSVCRGNSQKFSLGYKLLVLDNIHGTWEIEKVNIQCTFAVTVS